MKLRTRLGLSLAGVSLLSAGGLFATANVVLQKTWARGQVMQDDAARARVELGLEQLSLRLQENVRDVDAALARETTPRGDDLLRSALDGDLEAAGLLKRRVGEEAGRRTLDVLDLVRGDGRVLASAHLPESYGIRVDAAAPLRHEADGIVFVQAGATSASRLAFVHTRRLENGPAEVSILAGIFLDDPARLRALSGGAEFAELAAPGHEPVVLEPPRDPFRAPVLSNEPAETPEYDIVLERAHPILPSFDAPEDASRVATLRIGRIDAGREALRRLRVAFLAISAVLLLACVPAASMLARRFAAPIDALASGARALATGDLDHRVAAPAGGRNDELVQLVEAFNGMARDLKDSRARLLQSERVAAWREIARQIAHEIKNPLTPIQLAVETTRRAHREKRGDFDEIFEESAAAILEEVDSLKKLVKEFSEFARMPQPLLAPEDLNDTVRAALRLFSGLPEGVRVETVLAGGLPKVTIDREQISRVVLNLVANAADAVGGKGVITVRTETAEDGDRGLGVRIHVEDDGPGIPESDREKVFAPYFTTKATGTGLGLAIVQRIVSDHGGEISVGKARTGGADFIVRLRPSSPSRNSL